MTELLDGQARAADVPIVINLCNFCKQNQAEMINVNGRSFMLNADDKFVPEGSQYICIPCAKMRARNQPIVTQKLPGRNQACPCRSGKKYKVCCGRK